nr:hypothetical protein HmN_000975100 [Hymenolepis microstoma]
MGDLENNRYGSLLRRFGPVVTGDSSLTVEAIYYQTLRQAVSNMSRGGIPKGPFTRHLGSWLGDIWEVAYGRLIFLCRGKQKQARLRHFFGEVRSMLPGMFHETSEEDTAAGSNLVWTDPEDEFVDFSDMVLEGGVAIVGKDFYEAGEIKVVGMER